MRRLLIPLCLFPTLTLGQVFESERASIPVSLDGRNLMFPWNGGYNTLGIAMTDADGDSDTDLFLVGRDESRLVYYRNDGSGHLGEFTLVDENLSDLPFSMRDNRLAFDDFDGDGDADLFVGENDGRLRYYRNDGGPSNPSFTLETDFFDDIDVGFVSSAAFGDLNGDGRRDLVVGSFQEGFFYYIRTAAGSPHFDFVDTLRAGDGEILVPGQIFYTPGLVDIDNDGDLDLFGGSSEDGLAFFRNDGSPTAPQFELVDAAFVDPPEVEGFLTPAFTDIDDDGDFDLFMGNNTGVVSYYRNDGTPEEAQFVLIANGLGLDYLDFGFYGTPALADIDADGDLDLFVAPDRRDLVFMENVGTATNPAFDVADLSFVEAGDQRTDGLAWVDLDGDGDLDLVYGVLHGGAQFRENTGTATNPAIADPVPLLDESGGAIEGFRQTFADIDADGDLDMMTSIEVPGDLRGMLLFENLGTPESFSFTSAPDTVRDDNGGVIGDFDSYPHLADFDSDGDPDLFLGNSDGFVAYYQNVGTPQAPSFSSERRFLTGIETGINNRNLPAFADLDGDGDVDAVIGRFQGGLFFYRNQSEVTRIGHDILPGTASLELHQNYPNPFQEATEIRFRLSEAASPTLRVFDLLGREIRMIELGPATAGAQTVTFDAGRLPSGVYLYRVDTEIASAAAKMVVRR